MSVCVCVFVWDPRLCELQSSFLANTGAALEDSIGSAPAADNRARHRIGAQASPQPTPTISPAVMTRGNKTTGLLGVPEWLFFVCLPPPRLRFPAFPSEEPNNKRSKYGVGRGLQVTFTPLPRRPVAVVNRHISYFYFFFAAAH